MPCCGGKRAAVRAGVRMQAGLRVPASPQFIVLEYVGAGGLREVGPVTRRPYEFRVTGTRLAVDARDAASMLLRRDLRRVAAS